MILLGFARSASGAAGLGLAFSCPATPPQWGSVIEITGSVTNTGTESLTNIVIVDSSAIAPSVVITTIPLLNRREQITFTGSYVVAPSSICSINHNLAALATSTHGDAVSNSVFSICPAVPRTDMRLIVNCPSWQPAPGESFQFTGTITNMGNAPVTSMILDVYQSGSNVLEMPVYGFLYPGQGALFSGSYPISTNLPAPVNITNTFILVGLTSCESASDTFTQICPLRIPTVTNSPQLTVYSVTSDTITLSWPTQMVATYLLQINSDLTKANWLDMTNSPVVVSNNNQITVPRFGANAFFRLKVQ